MYTFLGIHWQNSQYILALPLVIFVLWYVIRFRAKMIKGMNELVNAVHLTNLFPHFSFKRQKLKTILWVIALLSIFLALLQPQWGKKEQVVQQEGRDVLILLDISRSMLAEDIKPNRLEFVKLKIRNLLSKLDVERMGLILFSGSAFVQCPLTADHDAFLMFLEQVDVETIASGTTAIDTALLKAMDVFNQSVGRKNKLVLLITDGEDFSLNLPQVMSRVRQEGVKILTLGVGTSQGAPIPVLDAAGNKIGHEKTEKGEIALSKLNEDMLTKLSRDCGGVYARISYDESDLNQIVSAIRRFEKEKFGDKKVSLYEERYPWLLGLAWVCLALEWVL